MNPEEHLPLAARPTSFRLVEFILLGAIAAGFVIGLAIIAGWPT